jgi:hypothetical protein
MKEKQKRSKDSVDYGAGSMREFCGICAHFEYPRSCDLVSGEICPEDWCKLFEKDQAAA